MKEKTYGFQEENIGNGKTCKTLSMGDGNTHFVGVVYENGDVGVCFSHGRPLEDPTGFNTIEGLGAEIQMRYETVDSIDAVIHAHMAVRDAMVGKQEEEKDCNVLLQVDGVTVGSILTTGRETHPQLRLAAFRHESVNVSIGDKLVRDWVIIPGKLVNILTEK